jgi:hypothetical protein
MHRSKLAGFIIDCQTQNLQDSAQFWGSALGMTVRPFPDAEGDIYMELLDHAQHLHVEVQTVTHPSRVHLDIETDDIDAEVRRLEKLGAVRVAQVKSWWVMEAPTGHRFCVVHRCSPDFDRLASEWP